MDWEQQLENIYNNQSHPASFSGAKKLKFFLQKNGTNVSTYKIQKWLERQVSFTVYKDKSERCSQDAPL